MTEWWYDLYSARDAITLMYGYWTDQDESPDARCKRCGNVNPEWIPLPIHIAVKPFDVKATMLRAAGTPVRIVRRSFYETIKHALVPHVTGEVWVDDHRERYIEEYITLYGTQYSDVKESPWDFVCPVCHRFIPGPSDEPFIRQYNMPDSKYQALMTSTQRIIISQSIKNSIPWAMEFPDITFERVLIKG